VLVVDDDLDVLEALEELLRDHGYDVSVASDGGEALALLREHRTRFALIILDWLLPRASGSEVMAQLDLDPVHRATPVVVLSGHDRIAPTHGVSAVIAKPVHSRTMLMVVERLAGDAPPRETPGDSVPVPVPIERRARLRSQTISIRRPR
jgi:CheY-like chemotaxis protein